MFLLIHITIALASLVQTAYLSFFPSKSKIQIAYVLVFLTFATGTQLMFTHSASLMKICFSGLTYLGLVSLGLTFAHKRLSTSSQ